MENTPKNYVRNGLFISGGLSFDLEHHKEVDFNFVGERLIYTFMKVRRSAWKCSPIFPSEANQNRRGIEYVIDLGQESGLFVRKNILLPTEVNFELDVYDAKRKNHVKEFSAVVRDDLKLLFDHVHSYASHAF